MINSPRLSPFLRFFVRAQGEPGNEATSILKSLESQLQEPDCMLCSLTDLIWRAKASDKDTDRLAVAVLKAALFVAEQQKAVLLPQASQVFLQAYWVDHTGSIKSVELNLAMEVGEGTVQFSLRWLLNQFVVYLSPYMSYKCVHMKFGTILYRKGVDLLTSLSWALGILHYTCKHMHQRKMGKTC